MGTCVAPVALVTVAACVGGVAGDEVGGVDVAGEDTVGDDTMGDDTEGDDVSGAGEVATVACSSPGLTVRGSDPASGPMVTASATAQAAPVTPIAARRRRRTWC